MKNKILLITFLLLAMLPFINAEQQSLGIFELNHCVELKQTCANCTWINVTSVSYPNGSQALGEVEMVKTGTVYTFNFCNSSSNGDYIATGLGDPDGELIVWIYDFTITPNGEEASIGGAVLYIGLLIMLMVFLIGCVTLFMENDNLLAKVGFLGLGYLMIIAITFVAWNMASDFLTSAPFIIAMFRILFFVFIIGAFPLLIGAFAWYFIMIFKIKEIQRLMDKGFSEDEAMRRTSR